MGMGYPRVLVLHAMHKLSEDHLKNAILINSSWNIGSGSSSAAPT